MKPLDVGGVDLGVLASPLGALQPSLHCLLRSAHDALNHSYHPSPGVVLDHVGYHQALRQKKPRTSSLAGAKRLAKYLERLLLG